MENFESVDSFSTVLKLIKLVGSCYHYASKNKLTDLMESISTNFEKLDLYVYEESNGDLIITSDKEDLK